MHQVQEVEYMEASLERQLRSGGTSKYVGNFESLAGFPSLHIVYSTSSSRPTSYSLTHSLNNTFRIQPRVPEEFRSRFSLFR